MFSLSLYSAITDSSLLCSEPTSPDSLPEEPFGKDADPLPTDSSFELLDELSETPTLLSYRDLNNDKARFSDVMSHVARMDDLVLYMVTQVDDFGLFGVREDVHYM